MKLQQLISTRIHLQGEISTKPPVKRRIIEPQTISRPGAAFQFEEEVINFLFTKSTGLGVQVVYRLENALIDGYLLTEDGIGIAVEFKLMLNWNKSNVARSQLINFTHNRIFEPLALPPPRLGIILFKDFSGDWRRIQGERTVPNGWYRFYQEQGGYDQFMKIHLLQLQEGILSNPGLP